MVDLNWTLERCIENAKKYLTKVEWQKNHCASYKAATRYGWYEKCCTHMVEIKKIDGYWTKERCVEEANKYNTRVEWSEKSSGSHSKAYKNGWVDECCSHMERYNKPSYWTKERCVEEALKYKSKTEWYKSNKSSYVAAKKNSWYEECCTHMVEIKKIDGYWTKERCIEESKKYNVSSEWIKNSGTSYVIARTNGWLEECYIHIKKVIKSNGYWTKERCIEEAKKYETKTQWRRGNGSSYVAAKKNGWLKECHVHMIESKKPKGYWTLERCKEEALKYNTRSEWIKNSGTSYVTARTNGWLEQCCSHMTSERKPDGYWTKERCLEDAKIYNLKKEWCENSTGSYQAAHRKGWLEECCAHMQAQYATKEEIKSKFFELHSIYKDELTDKLWEKLWKEKAIEKRYPRTLEKIKF